MTKYKKSGTKYNNTLCICFQITAMHSVFAVAFKSEEKGEGSLIDIFLPRPGSTQGRISPKILSARAGP